MLVSMCGSSHQNNFLQNIDILLKAIKKNNKQIEILIIKVFL